MTKAKERLKEIAEERAALKEEFEKIEYSEERLAQIYDRLKELAAEEERAKADAAIDTTKIRKEKKTMSNVIESKEYRDAFMARIAGTETKEQRALLADNSVYGDGLALPAALDAMVWDQVHTAHPILADIARVNAGIPIKVTKLTPAAVTAKKDSAASSEQTFTSAEVTLVGKDYHTWVGISYAEAKMSQGAMEAFITKEIADAIGEALAKDVFAQIVTDCGTAQKVTPASTPDLFEDLKKALALCTQASAPVIYAPAAKYYEIKAAIKSGIPYNMADAVGCVVKLDNAATKVTVLDPSMFLLDVIQDTIIEPQRDAKEAKIVIAGYMRAEGCMRKTAAAAYIN